MQFNLLAIPPRLDELHKARERVFLLHHLEDFFIIAAILQQEGCDNMECWGIIFLR